MNIMRPTAGNQSYANVTQWRIRKKCKTVNYWCLSVHNVLIEKDASPSWSEHYTPDSPHPAQLLDERSFHRNVRVNTAPTRTPGVVPSDTPRGIPLVGWWIGHWRVRRWWRCRCRYCNLGFLRLVAAAVFCWAQCLCVCARLPWNGSQLTETAASPLDSTSIPQIP